MKKTFNKEIHDGYEIGKNISIHNHISDKEGWFLTIRPLNIFGKSLCKKTCTEPEIARYIYQILRTDLNILNNIIKEVAPLT
jgi:hypothetical protein